MKTDVKYRSIFEQLRRELLAGRYAQKTPLPSEMQLVRRFGVSRFTAAQAIACLVREGLAVRHKGKGTYPTRFARLSSGPIGLVMPGLSYGEIYAPICNEIVRLSQECSRTVLLSGTVFGGTPPSVGAIREMARDFVRQRVSGVIMHPIEYLRDAAGVNGEIVSIFDNAGIPVVLLDFDISPLTQRSGHDLVGIDNFACGMKVGEHLLAAGAKRIVFVRRRNCATTVVQRTLGVAQAVVASGGKWTRENVLEAEPGDEHLVLRLLRGRNRPDALVCGYDAHAVDVMGEIRCKLPRLVLPRDLKIASFDDVRLASVVSPALTSIHQPCAEMARAAVETLFRRMTDPARPVSTTLLDAPLVVRDSTKT